MVSTRSRGWLATTIQLFGLLSTVEAVNLSQFQLITSDQVPANCLSVYVSTINGCVQSDFTTGGACSTRCMQGLQTKQSQIQLFCANLVVNPKSLLGLALSGDLLGLLCPGEVPPSIPGFTTIPVATSIATTIQPPPTATTTTTTTGPVSTVDPKDPDPTQDTTATTPEQPATTLVSSSSSTSTSTTSTKTFATSVVSSQTTANPAATPQTTTAQTVPAPTQVAPPVESGDPDPGPVIEQNGSPFVNINFNAASHSVCAPRLWSMAVAALFLVFALVA